MKNDANIDVEVLDIPEYIDQPEYVKNKTANYTLQTIGWFCLMWLLFPLVSLFLWIFEGHLIYDYVWVDHVSEVKTLLHLLLLIGLSALILIYGQVITGLDFMGMIAAAKLRIALLSCWPHNLWSVPNHYQNYKVSAHHLTL